MNDFGVKITKPRKDVGSEKLYDYNLWSKYPVGKIALEDDGEGSPSDIKEIDYGLYAEDDSIWLPYISGANGDLSAGGDRDDWYLAGFNCPLGTAYAYDPPTSVFNYAPNSLGPIWTDGVAYFKYFVLVDSFKTGQISKTTGHNDYGIKISKEGKDVRFATDRDLIYSSQWKSLKVIKEGSGVTDSITGLATIRHDLGFSPAFLIYEDNTSYKGAGYWSLNHHSHADTENLFIDVPGGGGKNFRYKIFANPLSRTSSQKPSGFDYGMKVSERGQDVKDASLHELAFQSGLGTMQIWKTLELTLNNPNDDVALEGSVTHGLGFVPAYIGWVSLIDNAGQSAYYLVGASMDASNGTGKLGLIEVTADNNKIYLRLTPSSASGVGGVGATAKLYLFCYEKLL